jgi:hypothetical protein
MQGFVADTFPFLLEHVDGERTSGRLADSKEQEPAQPVVVDLARSSTDRDPEERDMRPDGREGSPVNPREQEHEGSWSSESN